jgi:hypothetical protein
VRAYTGSLSLTYRPTQGPNWCKYFFSCYIAGYSLRGWRNFGRHLFTAISTCSGRGDWRRSLAWGSRQLVCFIVYVHIVTSPFKDDNPCAFQC